MILPLQGVTVLDLTAHRAGPTCVRQLADWGAEVIKIEPPGGAKGDAIGSRRHATDFQNLHRNKRSMTLDLKSGDGHAIFMRSEEHTSELQSLMRNSYAVFCLKKKNIKIQENERSISQISLAQSL